MRIDARTPEDYFAQLTPDRREQLSQVRALIKRVWPKIREDVQYGMPTYHLDGSTFCALASQKSFMAIYIMPYDLLNAFKLELVPHDTGRSCIRFRKLDEAKLLLFERVLKYTGSRFADSRFYGKHTHTGRTLARA